MIILKCRTVTPMLCYGADGKTAELRPPSFKGALRYWWRAIHPNLSITEMSKQEANLFGGAGDNDAQKSNLQFFIQSDNFDNPLPDKTPKFWPEAIPANTHFEIVITRKIEYYQELFILTSLVGGIGNRSRRGFGGFQIDEINGKALQQNISREAVLKLIKTINPEYKLEEDYQRRYPYLRNIMIGEHFSKEYQAILTLIGESSHEFDTPYTGRVTGGRYASPIYVSVIQSNGGYKPIVTTLKRTIPDISESEEIKKDNFIKAILGGV